MRKAHGFPETDKPSIEETIRGIGVKLNNPVLATWGLDAVIPPKRSTCPPPGVGGWDAPTRTPAPKRSPPRNRLDH